MGELGRRISNLKASNIIADLVRAHADEWFGHYNFQFTANALRGHYSPSIIELLERKSARALARANRLAGRISELGGQPTAKLTDLVKQSSDKPFKLPRRMSDVSGVLKAVLDAERTSIRTFHGIYRKSFGKDPVTQRLAEDLLGEAVHGEDEVEKLIGDPAPEMKGD